MIWMLCIGSWYCSYYNETASKQRVRFNIRRQQETVNRFLSFVVSNQFNNIFQISIENNSYFNVISS